MMIVINLLGDKKGIIVKGKRSTIRVEGIKFEVR